MRGELTAINKATLRSPLYFMQIDLEETGITLLRDKRPLLSYKGSLVCYLLCV